MNNNVSIEEHSRLQGLSALMQKWAELCRERSKREMSPHLQWFIRGMGIAHQLDAWRARDLCNKNTSTPPVSDLGLVSAFESLLNMAQSLDMGHQKEESSDED